MNLVFDFGVVLFNWQPVKLVASTFPDQASTDEKAQQLVHLIFGHEDWHSFDRGTLELDDVVLRTSVRLKLPHAPLLRLVSGIGDHLTPVEESVAVVKALQQRRRQSEDLRLYFLSNMPMPYARVLETRHEFLTEFDGGVFSGDVKLIKPEPAIYALLESRYGLVPDRTVFIDDLKTNVDVARSRGWHGIHFESSAQMASDLRRYGYDM